jgi:hypothetical protein
MASDKASNTRDLGLYGHENDAVELRPRTKTSLPDIPLDREIGYMLGDPGWIFVAEIPTVHVAVAVEET